VSTDPRDVKGVKLLQRVAADALEDDNYRQRLIDNPKSVLGEAGLSVPDDTEVVVHQNGPNQVHLVLPSRHAPAQALHPEETNVHNLIAGWPI
jgi:hypothetical protein